MGGDARQLQKLIQWLQVECCCVPSVVAAKVLVADAVVAAVVAPETAASIVPVAFVAAAENAAALVVAAVVNASALLLTDENEHHAWMQSEHLYGPQPSTEALFHQIVGRIANLSAAWVATGFCHGALNTGNPLTSHTTQHLIATLEHLLVLAVLVASASVYSELQCGRQCQCTWTGNGLW